MNHDRLVKVLILGVTGMLGHGLFRHLSSRGDFDVHGTARSLDDGSWFLPEQSGKIYGGVEAEDPDTIAGAVRLVRPDVVINCIGLIKQSPLSENPVRAIALNALLPHQVAAICRSVGARMIHMSTDCVFDGAKGMYREDEPSNADDLYGRTKFLGEVNDKPLCLTIRSSIIGHEIKGKRGLIEWFLAQEGTVRGFTRAVFSGFPTVEFSRIIADHVIPKPELTGVMHVSSDPISKFELLQLVAARYGKIIDIEPFDDYQVDRSLDSSLFRGLTGYVPPSWPDMVNMMYRDYVESHLACDEKV